MRTTVIKCNEVVDNSNLRGMNELQVTLFKGSNSDIRGYFGKVRTIDDGRKLIYKVRQGNAKLFNNSSTSVYSDSAEATGLVNGPYVQLVSDEAKIGIMNEAIIANMLGNNSDTPFYISSDGGPRLLCDLKEISNLNITKIYSTGGQNCYFFGDLKYLGKVNDINIVGTTISSGLTDYHITGDISDLKAATNIRIYGSPETVARPLCYFNYSDLAELVNCNSFYFRAVNTRGGDIYDLLKSKTELSFEVFFAIGSPFICSYTTGDIIPTITINTLTIGSNTNSSYPTVDNCAALLTLLKDGKNANKITLPANIRISMKESDRSNPTITSLVSDLSALGCTVNLV